MSKQNKTKTYFPTEEDKTKITSLCDKVIGILEPLTIEQKAFALQMLVSSFEDVAGFKISLVEKKK